MMDLVILGGGFCGINVARRLEKQENIEVTLIDKKSFFEYTPSILKVVFNPRYRREISVPFNRVLDETRIITNRVDRVTPHHIEVNGKKISFDYLVISTGIKYPIFLENKKNVFTLSSLSDALKVYEALHTAENVLVVGGGLIGTEIASEIVTKYPEKNVIVVHSKERLIERNPSSASVYAKRFLEDRGAKIIFGEKVVENRDGSYVTSEGRILAADTGIWSAGISWNPMFLENFESSVFSARGALEVDRFLRLKGYSNIFVGGDITGIDEEKNARNAKRHGEIIAKNLKRSVSNVSLIPYVSEEGPVIISLGDKKGIVVFGDRVFTGYLPGLFKWAIHHWTMCKLDGPLRKIKF